ncbi:hypothetical protein ACYFX5_20040 [Bremerella sp. T1]|uniref:hypothetical protein n=1 Tax=Bremerella sp. TYQ1 TaxID=3119568 RepID=UPI001CD0044C|nr:hypothetical protein [Bremerella volcania]UBM35334.1 hypothetical protein LA756_21985 [Bremerella volcania]
MNNPKLYMQKEVRKDFQESLRLRIYDDWFAEKRYVSLLVFKNSCPLSHHERLTYSFVRWLHWIDPDQSKPYSKIAPRLAISEKAVSGAARSLEKRGLLSVANGPSNRAVLRLTDDNPDWLVIGSNGLPASNRLYQPGKFADSMVRLTSYDAALLASLYGLAIKRGSMMIQNAKSGLASMTSLSTKTVASCLTKLSQIELVQCFGSKICLLRPSELALRHFVDCGNEDKARPTPNNYFRLKDDSSINVRLNCHLIQAQNLQFSSGWNEEQTYAFWKNVLGRDLKGLSLDDRLSLLEDFLIERYPSLWLAAEDQHRETGKAGNCRYLLAASTEDLITRLRRERGY